MATMQRDLSGELAEAAQGSGSGLSLALLVT